MKMEHTECSETSAYKTQTPGNYPEESIQHSEQGESLKSLINFYYQHYTKRKYALCGKSRVFLLTFIEGGSFS